MNICAIVTMYYPDNDCINKMIKEVSSVVNRLYVVDNSNGASDVDIYDGKNIDIITQDNKGITGAVNIAIKQSKLEFDYYLILDQDSNFDTNNIKKLFNSAVKNNIDITAPKIIDKAHGEIHHKHYENGIKDGVFRLVNRTQLSGMLISKIALEKVGLFNESYFLNLGDTEWCLRARKNNIMIHINTESIMYHEYGDGFKEFLNYRFFYGSPFRLYYRSRDALRLINSNVSPVGLKFKLLLKLIITPFEIFFLDDKKERFKYFFRGFLSYLKGDEGCMK